MNYNLISKFIDPTVCKYLFAGLANTVFGYSLFSILIFIGVDYKVAITISTVIGVIFNYFNFGRNVFSSKNSKFIFFKFVTSYIFSYLLNICFMYILVDYFLYNPYISQGVCTLPLVMINWFILKFWTFK